MLTLGKIAIYFQAIRGATTLESGLMYIPLALSMAISALASGPLTSAIGYNNPALMNSSRGKTRVCAIKVAFKVKKRKHVAQYFT
jgi:hypothetical protein